MKNNDIKISASILSADFARLGEEIMAIDKAGVDMIHVDVMDGNFVPNITIGPDVIRSIRKFSNKVFDTHLMIQNPQNFIEDFANAGSDIITIHHEATIHLDATIKKIKSFGKMAGISIVPSSNENVLDYVINDVDLILIMSVNPGFGGQKFLDSQLSKIRNIRNKIGNRKIFLEVDGGINDKTAKSVIEAGADLLVSGSYIFNAEGDIKLREEVYKNRINLLKSK